jgi:hypothetical protein
MTICSTMMMTKDEKNVVVAIMKRWMEKARHDDLVTSSSIVEKIFWNGRLDEQVQSFYRSTGKREVPFGAALVHRRHTSLMCDGDTSHLIDLLHTRPLISMADDDQLPPALGRFKESCCTVLLEEKSTNPKVLFSLHATASN